MLKKTWASNSKSGVLIPNSEKKYDYYHQDGSYSPFDLENKICSCAWNLDKGICKHLVAACIKTTTNLTGLAFMTKVLVTCWKINHFIYMSPLKSSLTNQKINGSSVRPYD